MGVQPLQGNRILHSPQKREERNRGKDSGSRITGAELRVKNLVISQQGSYDQTEDTYDGHSIEPCCRDLIHVVFGVTARFLFPYVPLRLGASRLTSK